MTDKDIIFNYLRDNLSLGFNTGEEGELLLEIYLEDDVIDSKKFPLDTLFRYLANISHYYD